MTTRVITRQSTRSPSWLDVYFHITARGSTIPRELVGGIATWLVGAYIIFVNPSVLSFAGIAGLEGMGPPFGSTLAVTCLSAGIMTMAMGMIAKYPYMMAPGMGLNAVVAFQLIVGNALTWQEAMGVIFMEGVLITALVLTGLRERVMGAIPLRLKRSIAVGIGFFILFIGLVNGGFVIMSGVPSAPVSLGSLTNWTFGVTAFGLLVTIILVVRGVRGAILFGIIASTVFAVIVNHFTNAYAGMPGMAVIPSDVVSNPDFSTFGEGLNFGAFAKMGTLSAVLAIASLAMADFFDTMGSAVGLGEQAGFVDEEGNYPKGALRRILLIDSLGAAFGGFSSASSNTTYIESSAGIAEGARTGLASVVTGGLFLAAMFFTPIASIVPPQATASALVIVGALMFVGNVPDIVAGLQRLAPREALVEGLPALLTMLVMPLTFSITNGIGAGFITYTVVCLAAYKRVSWTMVFASAAFILYFVYQI